MQPPWQPAAATIPPWRRSPFKKPYVSMLFDCADGSRRIMDRTKARRSLRLRLDAASIASFCGKPLVEG